VDRCLQVCPNDCLQLAGRKVEAKTLAEELRKTAETLGDSFGGFTFSGGEPLAQPEFLLELMQELKPYHLCIETCGYTSLETFKKVLDVVDFVIMDIKLADNTQHKRYTGVENTRIIENFRFLQSSGKPYLIRTPLIPKITDTRENLMSIQILIGESRWEQLPYNAAAGAKYKSLGMTYPL
jgi:pyruvate formate lyase activating enzyme